MLVSKVQCIVNKAGKHLYTFQLKMARVCQSDLVCIFVMIIRPVVEYACPVWRSGLPRYLSDTLEMVQKRAVIHVYIRANRTTRYYPGESYNEILKCTDLPILAERRSKISREYFDKIKKENH